MVMATLSYSHKKALRKAVPSDGDVCDCTRALLRRLLPKCKQVWFADDATGCDKFETMRAWFDALVQLGPIYGYFPKPSKCILLAKPDRVDLARKVFKGSDIDIQTEGAKNSGVEIISDGTRNLGAAVGTEDFKHSYVKKKKVDSWIHVIEALSTIAASEPHAVFVAYTHCLQSQWTFLCRSMSGTPLSSSLLKMPFVKCLFLPSYGLK